MRPMTRAQFESRYQGVKPIFRRHPWLTFPTLLVLGPFVLWMYAAGGLAEGWRSLASEWRTMRDLLRDARVVEDQ